jgi:hypothetical protein
MRRLTKNLLNSSIDAFILAIGIINNPSVTYRLESFVVLLCNAWELLMKAKLYQNGGKIFYPKKRNKPKKSRSLDDCLNQIFTSSIDPIKKNIIKIAELRNNIIHLVIPFIPPNIMGLFQASILNFRDKIGEWFEISLTDRINPGMMALMLDFDPKKFSFEHLKASRKLPSESIKWIQEFQNDIAISLKEFDAKKANQFFIPINLNLAIVRNLKKADIVLSSGKQADKQGLVMEVPKDPDKTHPNRQKELIIKVNEALQGDIKINSYDCKVIRKIYNVDERNEWFYQSKIPGRSPQYSDVFVNWLIMKAKKDANFFKRARKKIKNPLINR